MNGMIEDVLETARLASGLMELRTEPANLADMVPAIVEGLGPPTGRIRVECPTGLPPVPVDRARIERAVVNLVTNALKFSPPDSPVTVRVSQGEGAAIVSVADQGVGIAPEDQQHIFDRFRRAQAGQAVEGLGLGLYITRLIAEAHGGRIGVDSEPGKGSTFSLTLPLSAP